MVSIPSDIFDIYKEYADEMISSLGVNCTIYYQKKLTEDNSLSNKLQGGISLNRYLTGGNAPYNVGKDPLQGGNNYKEEAANEVVKLRVYFDRKAFIKVAETVNIPDGAAQIIGHIGDMPKIERCSYIILNSDLKNQKTWKYVRFTECYPWGLGKNKYFVCFLERTS